MEYDMRKNSVASRIVRFVGVVIGTIAFLWFLLPFLVSGVLNIGNMTGLLVSLFFAIYMRFQPIAHDCIRDLWEKHSMRWVIGGCVAILATIGLLVVIETGCMVNACMEKPAENATAVVLGCRVYGERPSLSLVERLEAAYVYLEENPNAACVVSGGQGEGENISEAEAMYRWLVARGIEKERIYMEDRSTSTEENIAYSKQIIEENGLNKNIAIVTSEYHSYRAGIIAEKHNLSFGAAPGQTAWWTLPTFYVRELYAILAEWIF